MIPLQEEEFQSLKGSKVNEAIVHSTTKSMSTRYGLIPLHFQILWDIKIIILFENSNKQNLIIIVMTFSVSTLNDL